MFNLIIIIFALITGQPYSYFIKSYEIFKFTLKELKLRLKYIRILYKLLLLNNKVNRFLIIYYLFYVKIFLFVKGRLFKYSFIYEDYGELMRRLKLVAFSYTEEFTQRVNSFESYSVYELEDLVKSMNENEALLVEYGDIGTMRYKLRDYINNFDKEFVEYYYLKKSILKVLSDNNFFINNIDDLLLLDLLKKYNINIEFLDDFYCKEFLNIKLKMEDFSITNGQEYFDDYTGEANSYSFLNGLYVDIPDTEVSDVYGINFRDSFKYFYIFSIINLINNSFNKEQKETLDYFVKLNEARFNVSPFRYYYGVFHFFIRNFLVFLSSFIFLILYYKYSIIIELFFSDFGAPYEYVVLFKTLVFLILILFISKKIRTIVLSYLEILIALIACFIYMYSNNAINDFMTNFVWNLYFSISSYINKLFIHDYRYSVFIDYLINAEHYIMTNLYFITIFSLKYFILSMITIAKMLIIVISFFQIFLINILNIIISNQELCGFLTFCFISLVLFCLSQLLWWLFRKIQ